METTSKTEMEMDLAPKTELEQHGQLTMKYPEGPRVLPGRLRGWKSSFSVRLGKVAVFNWSTNHTFALEPGDEFFVDQTLTRRYKVRVERSIRGRQSYRDSHGVSHVVPDEVVVMVLSVEDLTEAVKAMVDTLRSVAGEKRATVIETVVARRVGRRRK